MAGKNISLIEQTEKHMNVEISCGKWANEHYTARWNWKWKAKSTPEDMSVVAMSGHLTAMDIGALPEDPEGTMNLKIPKLRPGTYYPSFLEPRRRSEQIFVAVIQEVYVKGVSIRKVNDPIQNTGIIGISKSQVSKFCWKPDSKVQKFLGWLIGEWWPWIWLNATYLKAQVPGKWPGCRPCSECHHWSQFWKAVVGTSWPLLFDPGESETFRTKFLRSLKGRGLLGGVKLIIDYAYKGLRNAGDTDDISLPAALPVHFIRNGLTHTPKNRHQMVASIISTAFDQPTQIEASTQRYDVADQLREKFPTLGKLIEGEVSAFISFSPPAPPEDRRYEQPGGQTRRSNGVLMAWDIPERCRRVTTY